MFPVFIGIEGKFLNLNNIDMIQDVSTASESIAEVVTVGGNEIRLTGEDAELLFDRAELITRGSDAIFMRIETEAAAVDSMNTADDTGEDGSEL
jgi:hypothetical protein